jgi:signal transduction histidine kinase
MMCDRDLEPANEPFAANRRPVGPRGGDDRGRWMAADQHPTRLAGSVPLTTGLRGSLLLPAIALVATAVPAAVLARRAFDGTVWLIGLAVGLALLVLAVVLDAVLVLRSRRPLELAVRCLQVATDDLAATNADLARTNRMLQETAAERTRALEQLEAAVRERQRFLESVSHDLRTPLTVIKGHAELLHRRATLTDDPQATRLAPGLASITASATQMAGLIDDLFEWVTLGTGQIPALHRGPTDLVALVEKVASKHARPTGSHRLRLETTVPVLVGHWDAQRLERMLDNLISNAIKYSPAGGDVRVVLSLDEGAAVLSVRDDGIGIRTDDLPRVFEPYYRAENAAEQAPGSGLGLVGVRRTVEAHGGTVAIESREGQGSTFTVRLPLDGTAELGSVNGAGQDETSRQ